LSDLSGRSHATGVTKPEANPSFDTCPPEEDSVFDTCPPEEDSAVLRFAFELR